LKVIEEWAERIRLNDEKHLLGTYMTGHPLRSVQPLLMSYRTKSISKILESPVPPKEKEVSVAGLVNSVKVIVTKKGKKMAFFTMEDLEAQIEVVIFSDLFSKRADLITGDRLLFVRAQVVRESGSTRLLAREVSDVTAASFSQLQVHIRSQAEVEGLSSLMEEAKKFSGEIPMKIKLPVEKNVEGKALKHSHVLIDTPCQVQSNPRFLEWIENRFGKGSVSLIE